MTETVCLSCLQHGWTPLLTACAISRIDLVTSLLEAGADITTQNAVCSLACLMRLNLRYYQDGKTPLHLACERGHMKLMVVLLRAGADIDARDRVSRLSDR
jgi:ankyrin repeat protein